MRKKKRILYESQVKPHSKYKMRKKQKWNEKKKVKERKDRMKRVWKRQVMNGWTARGVRENPIVLFLILGYEREVATTREVATACKSPQGVARRPDHYEHCPLMDIYECTNQRNLLLGFNAIRIDYYRISIYYNIVRSIFFILAH